MSRLLYEQYKDALRRGHVAALRGRLEIAVAAYQEAAELAPDRALPYASIASVLHRLGRTDAAEAAYATALRQAPRDEGALRGRAVLRSELGRRSEAAEDFELLAEVLEAADRLVDACDAARRALELAESRARRRAVERLATKLRQLDADPAASEALRLALHLLEPPVERDRRPEPEAPTATDRLAVATRPTGADASPSSPAAPPTDEPASEIQATPAPEPPASPEVPTAPEPPASPEVDLAAPEPPASPEVDLAAPEPPASPEVDLAAMGVEAERLLDARDAVGARAVLLDLATRYRISGQLDAALDAGFQLLAIDPSDQAVQLELAAIQLDRGWTEIAEEKVRLLGRLAELDGDRAGAAVVAGFAAGERRSRSTDGVELER
jgi:tetratricopeptide (TPR) repeat protein